MSRGAWAIGSLAIVLGAIGVGLAMSGGTALEEVDPPKSFDPALVKRGAVLAAVGNCRGCHTTSDGRSFAGGRPFDTPFGTVHSTNITPDPATGIGRWSEEAFNRAMREGLDRRGRHLYPAFPYDRFTLVTDDDNRALYAYLMTRAAVAAEPPRNRLAFPMNVRATTAIWKWLFFRAGAYRPDESRSPTWNRGRYLVEGLGHCGSCHTPRNFLGAEKAHRHLEGGVAEGWHAYAINARSASPIPWEEEGLATYMRRGTHELHGVSRGPMALVTDDLSAVPEADVRAMAHYIVDRIGAPAPERARRAEVVRANPAPRPVRASHPEGARIYEDTCAGCHLGLQPLPFGGLPLALSIGASGESPRNLVNVILHGLPAAEGETSPMMPGYDGALDDRQVVALAEYIRAAFSGEPPWKDLAKIVREARASPPPVRPAGATGTDPARAGAG